MDDRLKKLLKYQISWQTPVWEAEEFARDFETLFPSRLRMLHEGLEKYHKSAHSLMVWRALGLLFAMLAGMSSFFIRFDLAIGAVIISLLVSLIAFLEALTDYRKVMSVARGHIPSDVIKSAKKFWENFIVNFDRSPIIIERRPIRLYSPHHRPGHSSPMGRPSPSSSIAGGQ
jgi:hypothetical protein